MMNSVFDALGGVLPTGEGLLDALRGRSEVREHGNSEGVEYSETDIERIETAADIMGEIFTDEVISNWENLTVEERAAYLNEYYAQAGKALGIDTKGVYVDDLQARHGAGVMGVNCGDGYLGIDVSLVADPSQLEELLDTMVHEMRHQLQSDALKNPEDFPDIPQETLDQWEYEMDHYIDGSIDFEGYLGQTIETDARAFGEEVVSDFVGEGGDEAFAMASQEAAAAGGLETEGELNRNTFSYTPGQCARISTGTQNYCPFAGSGR